MKKIDLAEVLDHAPVGSFHRRVVLLGVLIMLLDGYDIGVMGFVLPAVAADWDEPVAVFGPALSASLMGAALGSVLGGLMGDRIGRRSTLLALFLLGGAATLATTWASDRAELILWRFVTGIGMGGTVPNVIALATELMPVRRRALLVVLIYSGAPLGGSLGTLLAARIIPEFGWQSAFVVGGMLPFAIGVAAYIFLPESPRFLVTAGRPRKIVIALLRRLNPSLPSDDDGRELVVREEVVRGARVVELYRRGRGTTTALVWVLFIATHASVFFLVSWLASLLTESGFELQEALYRVSLFHFGALAGGVVVAWLSDRFGAERLLALTYFCAATVLTLLGVLLASRAAVPLLMFLAGATVIGSSLCLGALVATYYPTEIRSTGVGWGLSVGRLGSIASPLLGGAALAASWSPTGILVTSALAPLMCFVGTIALYRIRRERRGEPQTVTLDGPPGRA